jgi:long-chain acyl-CoA synthetase
METTISTVGQLYKNNYMPDKTAIIFNEERISYADLDDRVRAFANYLESKGITRGDKVMLDAGNCPEFIYIYFGTVRNAAIIVPVNPMLTTSELAYIAKDSESKYLIIKEEVLQKLGHTEETLSEQLGLIVFALNESFIAGAMASPRDDFDLVKDMRDLSTFLYTSGTTGYPKAVMLTHFNIIANSWQNKLALETVPEDIFLCVLPMFHVFACTAAVLMPLFLGGTVVIVETFQPKSVIGALLEHNTTVFFGVPAMYMVFIEAGKNNIFFPKLRLAISGGAPLPVDIYYKSKEIANLPIIEGYGLTEASPSSAFNPPSGVHKPGSIGLALVEIDAIIGGENDEELPIGEVGELLLRGPNVMQGYYRKPEETAETLRNGWLHTGDLAKMDEDRYIYIVDRKKDMIIVAGLNVYPREIEEVLYQHPKIRDAAVVGEEDQLRGESAVAYIVLKEEETAHHKEILRWLKERLAVYKIPRRLIFIDELPRNSSGKILKRKLIEKNSDI